MASIRSKSLRAHFSHSGSKLRPILTNLNGDSSWLISFPIPDEERQQANGKTYFHIVSDPWFTGTGSALHYYAANFTLPQSPAAKSGSDVEAIAYEIEELARGAGHASTAPISRENVIDAISVAQDAADHQSDDTLKTFRRDIPVVAPPTPAAAIRALNHFETVVDSLDLVPHTPSVRSLHPGASVLPPWLNVFRLHGFIPSFATAFVWSHPEGGTTKHEVIFNSPHSIRTQEPSVQKFLSVLGHEQDTTVLALLHGLKSNHSRFGQEFTFGVRGGLELERPLKPRYWVQSGDAKLIYGGIMFWLLGIHDVFNTLDWGLEKEAEKNGGVKGRRPNYLEIENGDCLVLE